MNEIVLYNDPTRNGVKAFSYSDFFNTSIKVRIFDDKIIFERVGIDYNGRVINPHFYKRQKMYSLHIMSKVPIGKYEFDEEESNEDIKVIYF